MDGVLQRSRQAVVDDTEDDHLANNTPAGSGSQRERLFTPESSPAFVDDEDDQRPSKRGRRDSTGEARTRPSDYLRARCPICFGGKSRFAEGYVAIYHVYTLFAYFVQFEHVSLLGCLFHAKEQ